MSQSEPPKRPRNGAGSARPHELVIASFDGVQLLDVAGPLEVFTAANRVVATDVYRIVVAATLDSVTTSSGVVIATTRVDDVRHADTLLVAGGDTLTTTSLFEQELLDALLALGRRSHRVCSVCSGALLLAETGLLDGKRVATHWAAVDAMERRHPSIHVDPSSIYVNDGRVWTSAGVTAGIDLALALVVDDLGPEVAKTIARWLILPARRSGSQTQFNPRVDSIHDCDDELVRALLQYIDTQLAKDLSIETLANVVHLSPRHLMRRFRAATGIGIAAHVQRVRLNEARYLLETTSLGLGTIARDCGFARRETFHRSFVGVFGVSPSRHREEFGMLERV